MFTGIIEAIGKVKSIEYRHEEIRLCISHPLLFQCAALGSSISVNGVCLTQAMHQEGESFFDVVSETLEKTNLGRLKEGDRVNLELSLRYGDRIDGHYVQGHVDGVAELIQIDQEKREILVELPENLSAFLVQKGSIALDGISLTVAELKGHLVRIAVIPTTWQKTHLHTKKVGDLLNVEIDVMAKQIQNYMKRYNVHLSGVLHE